MVLTVAGHGKSRRITVRVQLDTEVKELVVPILDSTTNRWRRYFFAANDLSREERYKQVSGPKVYFSSDL